MLGHQDFSEEPSESHILCPESEPQQQFPT